MFHERYSITSTRTDVSEDEKWKLFGEVSENLIEIFNDINLHLESKEETKNEFGLKKMIQVFEIAFLFTKSHEKFQTIHFLLKFIDFLECNIIGKTIKYLHMSENAEIILLSLKIISYYINVPSLALTKLPSMKYNKLFLMQNNLLEILLQLIEKPPNYEVKIQGYLTLGFLIKGSPQIRDMTVMQNGLNVIFKHYKNEASFEEIINISWVLSIISGATINNPIYNCDEKENLIELFIELLFWKV